MSEPDEALIDAIAEAITDPNATTPRRDNEHFSHWAARAAYAAMVEHLGLREETRDRCGTNLPDGHYCNVHPQRRLVSKWQEVEGESPEERGERVAKAMRRDGSLKAKSPRKEVEP